MRMLAGFVMVLIVCLRASIRQNTTSSPRSLRMRQLQELIGLDSMRREKITRESVIDLHNSKNGKLRISFDRQLNSDVEQVWVFHRDVSSPLEFDAEVRPVYSLDIQSAPKGIHSSKGSAFRSEEVALHRNQSEFTIYRPEAYSPTEAEPKDYRYSVRVFYKQSEWDFLPSAESSIKITDFWSDTRPKSP